MTGASNPHIAEPHSPLETLAISALRRSGDGAAHEADGNLLLMMLDFANEVIEDIRHHPYWPKDVELPYYVSLQDTRPVPDPIITAGLLAHYLAQQGSAKAQVFIPRYRQLMNQVLWNRLTDSPRPMMRVVDGGSNPRLSPRTDPNTGIPLPDPPPPAAP